MDKHSHSFEEIFIQDHLVNSESSSIELKELHTLYLEQYRKSEGTIKGNSLKYRTVGHLLIGVYLRWLLIMYLLNVLGKNLGLNVYGMYTI